MVWWCKVNTIFLNSLQKAGFLRIYGQDDPDEPLAKLRAAKLRAMFDNTQDYKSHKPCTYVDLLVEELEHPENLLKGI